MEQQIFSEKANEFWQINGAFKTLHDINPVRLNYIQNWLDYYKKENQTLSILDCGCGAGILTEPLAKLGAKLTGIDISRELIEVAKSHAKKNKLNINYFATEIENFNEKTNSKNSLFDVITCLEMLEHVNNPEKIIHHLTRHLKKDGLLFLSTLNRSPSSFINAIVIGEYLTNLIPKGTHRYQEFIKPSELDEVCRKNELELVDLSGLVYNPVRRKAKITSNLSTNYLACYMKR